MKPEAIETSRLILRSFTLDDIEAAYAMNLDQEVSKYTGDGGVVSKEEIERRIKEDVLGDYQKHGYGRMAVGINGGPDFIGFCGLKYLEDMRKVDLGYRFMSDYWGKGYATESCNAVLRMGFDQLKLNEIIAMVLPKNKASIRVLEKLNFDFSHSFEEDDMLIDLYKLDKANAHY
jgi:RimJ/RimL family protein N-acetyltransferase